MHGRLSGTGRLHGNRLSGIRVGTETIDFRFAIAIHTVQYASFDTINFIIMFY